MNLGDRDLFPSWKKENAGLVTSWSGEVSMPQKIQEKVLKRELALRRAALLMEGARLRGKGVS